MAQYSLGIDIGGTFTDLVVYDHEGGSRFSRKVLTTHDDPARAVAAGVAGLLTQARVDPAAVSRTVHATTLFTNALIERQGAVTGLITTAGFADTLEIGRERKYELYDLAIAKPEPLGVEHEQFRDAVLGMDADIVTLEQGMATVAVAEAVIESARTGTTVNLTRTGVL